jgi:hypothetical protein
MPHSPLAGAISVRLPPKVIADVEAIAKAETRTSDPDCGRGLAERSRAKSPTRPAQSSSLTQKRQPRGLASAFTARSKLAALT